MNSQQGSSSAASGMSSDEFVVTQVDMITEACPNEIQKRIEQQTKVLKSKK
jgi:hypothetical protein